MKEKKRIERIVILFIPFIKSFFIINVHKRFIEFLKFRWIILFFNQYFKKLIYLLNNFFIVQIFS